MSLVDESRDQEMPWGVESSVGVDRDFLLDKSWRWVVHQGCRVKTKESIPTYGMQTLKETEPEFYVRDKSFGEEEYPFQWMQSIHKKKLKTYLFDGVPRVIRHGNLQDSRSSLFQEGEYDTGVSKSINFYFG
ncbi:hypothetical protein QVD17_16076 [Tagetes erecta]|uniref:Uncharacterized protein n=1 Tax=Tagetes erecta TaxID=13708 RepID=A0AAD8KR22_TARER|nr:hypothetical protein QVD17_16076 [Tagetes erecta]